MGMEGNLRRIVPADLERALRDPSFLEPFVRRELPRELLEKQLARDDLPPDVRLHFERLAQPPPPGVEPQPAVDLHKTFHGIHYLLTGDAAGGEEPLSLAVMPSDERAVGEDLGYGPAGYLLPDEVRAVADALSQLDRDDLRQRYDPELMTKLEIYPAVVWLRDNADSFDWLMQFYEPVPDYYAEASARGDAMLVWIC